MLFALSNLTPATTACNAFPANAVLSVHWTQEDDQNNDRLAVSLTQTGLFAALCLSPGYIMKMTEETSRVILLSLHCKALPASSPLLNEMRQHNKTPLSSL